MEWVSRLIEFIRLPPRYFAIAALVSGCMLFLPDSTLLRLHLDTTIQKFGAIIGLVFIISCGLVVVSGCSWIMTSVQRRRELVQSWDSIAKCLVTLDLNECAVLREFLGRNTVTLPIDHPVVAGLINKGVIRRAGRHGRMGVVGMLFPCSISEAAEELITPPVLGIEPNMIKMVDKGDWELTEEGHEWLRKNRPAFVHEIAREDARFNRL